MFPGFPTEALTFLRGLTRHNDRDWFQPRRETFETHVKAPMIALCEALNDEFQKFAPEYVNEPKKAIYRIYRDTRFSEDKTPYKTHVGAVFPRRGLSKLASPGFYVALTLKGVDVAGGIYQPAPDQILAIRTWLAENHTKFRKASAVPEKLMEVKLHGESLQRIPKGFDAAHPGADLLKMKQWLYFTTLEPGMTTTPKLIAEVSKRFRSMHPVLEMLNEPLSKLKRFPERGADAYLS
jgi:uncharacterized protein (TIGR02453 family)